MSLSDPVPLAASPSAWPDRRLGERLLLAAAAVLAVAALGWLLAALLAPEAPPPPPRRSPFGMGTREAAPAAQGLGAAILAVQGEFFRRLQGAVSALKAGGGPWALVAVGFAYGVFHAAGPGHGKAVISGYIVASGRSLARGLSLSAAAALLQALVAVAIVGVAALALQVTARGMDRVTASVELVSFAAVAVVGLVLTWRKAGKLLSLAALARHPAAFTPEPCGHVHLPPPERLDRLAGRREAAGVVLAAGVRPCAGAIVVLVFALSQGLFWAGIAATLAMAVGTALTTGALASLAVFGKALALRLAGGRGTGGALAIAGLELLAAAFVLVLGASLLAGVWSGAGQS